ncbi:MAG: hypothetical protein E7361_02015 [Clostridiales bacterium]|nr:hypothetical protein [Clostridiales bacterium]
MAKYTEISSFEQLLSQRVADSQNLEKEDNLSDNIVEIFWDKEEFSNPDMFINTITANFNRLRLPGEESTEINQFPFNKIKEHPKSVSCKNSEIQDEMKFITEEIQDEIMSKYPNLVTFLATADVDTLAKFSDRIPEWIKGCENNYLTSIKSAGLRLDNTHLALAKDRQAKIIAMKDSYNKLADFTNLKVSQQLDLLNLDVPTDTKEEMGE